VPASPAGLSFDLLPAPAPRTTGTVLDDWVGGLPARGLTVFWGPLRCGRSTLLHTLARGLTTRTGIVHFASVEPLPRPFEQASVPKPLHHQHTSVEGLQERLQLADLADGDAVLIDDIDRLGYGGRGRTGGVPLSEGARARAELVGHLRGRDLLTIVGVTERAVRGSRDVAAGGNLDNSFKRAADLIVHLEPLARTRGPVHGGIVALASVSKSKGETPPPARLWMRPDHEIPLSFA
jgi:hypothetical protein